jgi:Zn-dependent protease
MLLFNLLNNPILFIGFIIGILSAITIHEAAHAWTAYKLGDPTAKIEGRVTLNPFAHLDFLGTIMLLFFGFGWGKPVPINERNFKSRFDEVKVSLAGVVCNFILAVLIAIVIRLVPMPEYLAMVLIIIIQINITIMIFNLLPIPPLDGSSLLKALLPYDIYNTLRQMTPYLFIAFIIFIYSTPYLSNFISNFTNYLLKILIGD